MEQLRNLDKPLNTNERYLYAIAVRQDIIIEQLNSIIDYIAKRDDVAVTDSDYEVTPGQISIEEVDVVRPSVSPEELTKQELTELLVKAGVSFNKRQNKQELIELLKNA